MPAHFRQNPFPFLPDLSLGINHQGGQGSGEKMQSGPGNNPVLSCELGRAAVRWFQQPEDSRWLCGVPRKCGCSIPAGPGSANGPSKARLYVPAALADYPPPNISPDDAVAAVEGADLYRRRFSERPANAEADLRAAWPTLRGSSLAPDRGGGFFYLDSSISRTLFASVAMANGFVSTDIPASK